IIRALAPSRRVFSGRSATGVGYALVPIGTGIRSSQGSGVFFPVDFAIDQGDVDPINPGTPIRKYVEIAVGAAPVMVFANVTNTNDGHLGDGLAASPPNWRYSNIHRLGLANTLTGTQSHTRDIAASGVTFGASNPPTAGYGDVGIHTFIREPLSGTYNTMEWCVPNSRAVSGDPSWGPGKVSGQDANVNPSDTSCSVKPCTVESGNPLWHIAANGGTRGRVIGSGEMIATVNSTADGFGYSFWSYPAFQGRTNIRYLTVDGVDPLYSGPSANPNGV